MDSSEKIFGQIPNSDIPDEFFKYSAREEHVGVMNPARVAQTTERMKEWMKHPEAFGFKKDLNVARAGLSMLI